MPVIFLDFDGVMVTERVCLNNLRDPEDRGHKFDHDAVNALNWLIDESRANIVVSSTWRAAGGRKVLQNIINRRGVIGRVLGRTPIHSYSPWAVRSHRGIEISEYRNGRWTDARYVILDDDDDMLAQQIPHFVRTEFKLGLTMRHARSRNIERRAMHVIKIIGLVTGTPTKYDGLYVDAYDPSYAPQGGDLVCYLKATADPNAARKFADTQEAIEFCLRPDQRSPIRADGHANCPIRAFTLQFMLLEVARAETAAGKSL